MVIGRRRRSDGFQRSRGCASKVRFRDEHEARKRGKRLGLRAYACRFCHGWHLTSARVEG